MLFTITFTHHDIFMHILFLGFLFLIILSELLSFFKGLGTNIIAEHIYSQIPLFYMVSLAVQTVLGFIKLRTSKTGISLTRSICEGY